MMQNINHIQLQTTNPEFTSGVILVENNKTPNFNPFRDEIFSSRPVPIFRKSIFYFVPTALYGEAKFLSTNILSRMGQVKLTPMRFIGNYRINKLKPVNHVNSRNKIGINSVKNNHNNLNKSASNNNINR